MPEDPQILTNRAAATRLRTLMTQLSQEPPSTLSTRLLKRLTPTPEERQLLTIPYPQPNNHPEAA